MHVSNALFSIFKEIEKETLPTFQLSYVFRATMGCTPSYYWKTLLSDSDTYLESPIHLKVNFATGLYPFLRLGAVGGTVSWT